MTVRALIEELQNLVMTDETTLDAQVFIVHKEWPVKKIDFKNRDEVVLK